MKRPGAVVVLLVLAGGFAVMMAPKVVQVQKLRERNQNLEDELIQSRRENQQLEGELKLLHEDPVYLEKVAREKFNKAKQGEIVYKIVHEPQPTPEKK